MKIDVDQLEKEILEEFFELNVVENRNPELTRQVAEVSARIVSIALKKISSLPKESE